MSGIALRDVPEHIHRAVKIGAAIQGLTMSAFILEVVENAPEVRVIAAMTKNVAPEQGQEGEDNANTG